MLIGFLMLKSTWKKKYKKKNTKKTHKKTIKQKKIKNPKAIKTTNKLQQKKIGVNISVLFEVAEHGYVPLKDKCW